MKTALINLQEFWRHDFGKSFKREFGLLLISYFTYFATQSALGVGFSALHSFNGNDGSSPQAGLIQMSDGILYGTTFQGGLYSQGTVFKIATNSAFTSLFSFTNAASGFGPAYGLAPGTNSLLYGVAGGGTNYSAYGISAGVIYRINTNGVYTKLHSLAFPAEGALPGPLVQSPNTKSFFGVTQYGGTNLNAEDQYSNVIGSGLLFSIGTNGTFAPLFSFGGTNGTGPVGPLTLAIDNHLYGMAAGGAGFSGLSPGSISSGYGTIFKVATNGTGFTNLTFFNGTNGANPDKNGLVQTDDGVLYGTTRSGGFNNYGTIFRVTTNGIFSNLYSFTGGNDGANPVCNVIQATDGNLYGSTYSGGTNNLGTLFEIGTNGVFQSLISFNGTNGAGPMGALIQGKDGNLYGTTTTGGTNQQGTVFAFQPSLVPIIISQPTNQAVPSGGTAMFSVSALGAVQLHYQWLSNSVPLTSQTNSTLILLSVNNSFSANYSVVVTNLYSSITSAMASLTVIIPIAITSQPVDQLCFRGQTIQFGATASGNQPLQYHWLFNSNGLVDDGHIFGSYSNTLVVSNATSADVGFYQLAITNIYTTNWTGLAKLSVDEISPDIIPAAIALQPYAVTNTAYFGIPPYTYSVTAGQLPPGLTLAGSGILSGVPTLSGGYTFTIQATDSLGLSTARSYSLTVNRVSWIISTNSLPDGGYTGHSLAYWNGYLYQAGGYSLNNGASDSSNVLYAKVFTNGTVGNWVQTTKMPGIIYYHSGVAANGYLYVLGGYGYDDSVGAFFRNSVFYSKVNPDGTIGTWQSANDLPIAPVNPSASVWSNNIYICGGGANDNSSANSYLSSNVYSAHIAADGSLSAWMQQPSLPEGVYSSCSAANGMLYVIGGLSGPNATASSKVYFTKIMADGNLSAWSQTVPTPGAYANSAGLASSGQLWTFGGYDGGAYITPSCFNVNVNGDGTLGNWGFISDLPKAIYYHAAAANEHFAFVTGGFDRTLNPSSSVFSIALPLPPPPPSLTLQNPTNPVLSMSIGQTYRNMGFEFLGSTDLLSWTQVGWGFTDTNGILTFTDTNAVGLPKRFYQAHWPLP